MLIYQDYSGELVSKYLGFPSICSSWFLFENQDIKSMVNYVKKNFGSQYIILNHQSYSVMGTRFMDYQGAFGLSNMPATRKNKYLSQKVLNVSNVYNDISIVDKVSDDELLTYLYKVSYSNFGLIVERYSEKIDVNKVLHKILNKYSLNELVSKLGSVSLFLYYDDCYRGLLTLHSSELLDDISKNNNDNISLKKINEINKIYGCRLAGRIKVGCVD